MISQSASSHVKSHNAPCLNEREPCQGIDPYWSDDTENTVVFLSQGIMMMNTLIKLETCLLYEFNVIDLFFTLDCVT